MQETLFPYGQGYSPSYREIHEKQENAGILYLRPEQIRLPGGKKREPSHNAVIRLAESMRKYGILEPITVRLTGDQVGFPTYELIYGHKRLCAARLIGLERLPCVVQPHGEQSYAIEDLVRALRAKGLHFFEQAHLIHRLTEDFGLTQEQIAARITLSQSAVANKLRLLRLTQEEQRAIREAGLTERHARAILRLTSPAERAGLLSLVCREKPGVAATESLVEGILHPQKPAVSVVLSPQSEPSGICPRKFALQDLRPLYNSIDRTLSIFRKTGQAAECRREEGENGVRIIITIPKKA